ncbi:hypothetical protein KAI54_00735, partial [Candidatus Gracilibacteria bacterium]|nr:hypothetical protein [Candidatus Gracilibacteria bacterium]
MIAKKKVCEIKGAWLITWKFHSPDEEELLKSLGIKDKIIDIIDSHKTFDYIADHMKRIYKILEGTYFDKVALSKCGKHKREREKV